MRWREWPYWIKGGLLTIPLAILILPLSFVLLILLGGGEDILWYLIPEFFALGMGLAMRGTPASSSEIIMSFAIVLVIFLVRIFFIGAILGIIYGKFAIRNKRKIFFIGLLILFIALIFLVSHRTQDISRSYDVNSPEECDSILKTGIENFDKNRCYKEFAVKNKDLSACDLINSASSIEKAPEDFKGFCYEEVAHAKEDSSICALIPEKLYNKHNATTNRRDKCYVWFKECERISDEIGRNSCWIDRAYLENNPQICEKVSGNQPYYNTTRCFENLNKPCDDWCLYDRARFNDDSSYCDKISSNQIKEQCLQNYLL